MSTDIFFSGRVVAPPDTLVRIVDGESVLLSLRTEHYYGLDDVGTRFWSCLTSAPTIAAACDILAAEFEAPLETIRRDVREFVAALEKRGLATVEGA